MQEKKHLTFFHSFKNNNIFPPGILFRYIQIHLYRGIYTAHYEDMYDNH